MTQRLLPFLVGAATGILSGFGVGGATLLLVYLTVFAGVDQQTAQGINLLYFLPAGLMALPSHFKNGYIRRQALRPALTAGLLCAAGTAWLATALDMTVLHRCFGGFLILIGLHECFGTPPKNEQKNRDASDLS